MPWVISFIVTWILFLMLVDYKTLKKNIFGGLMALLLGTIVDWGAQKLQLYDFRELIIPWFGCSAFYKLGPILTMGILFVQGVPRKKWMQVLNILMYSVIYLSIELLIVNTHVANYIHWSIFASLIVDLLLFCTFTWVGITFIRPKHMSKNE